MKICFSNKKLQKICNISKEANGVLGPESAKKLQQRLMELKAAVNLADVSRLPPTRCHELKNRNGQLSVDLKHPYRLLFVPAHNPMPENDTGGLDWSKVTEIEIVGINIDTH